MIVGEWSVDKNTSLTEHMVDRLLQESVQLLPRCKIDLTKSYKYRAEHPAKGRRADCDIFKVDRCIEGSDKFYVEGHIGFSAENIHSVENMTGQMWANLLNV